MNKSQGYIRNLLFLLLAVYFAQGSLYSQGSIFSQISLFLIYLISGFYLIKTLLLSNKKNLFYKSWTFLLLLNLLGYIFFNGENVGFGMFKRVLLSLLPFYPFYYFALIGQLNAKHLLRFFVMVLPVAVLQYFFNRNQILLDTGAEETIVNNIAYFFVALIPFLFLFKNKKMLSVAAMLIVMYFIIQGAKRGALLVSIIGLLWFIYFYFRTVDRNSRIKGYSLVGIITLIVVYFGYDFLMKNEFLIQRLENIGTQGGMSGRDIIYRNVFNGWYNSESVLNLLFGYGFAASLVMSGVGSFAHNDWLELLSNFGLLGVITYAVIFYGAIGMINNPLWDKDKKILLLTIVSMWFVTTLFSMNYTSSNGYIQAIFLGYLLGNKQSSIV